MQAKSKCEAKHEVSVKLNLLDPGSPTCPLKPKANG